MILVAVTGSICSGKTFVCKLIEELGFQVFYCDAEIHKILKTQEIIDQLKSIFPEAFLDGRIDRKSLGDVVFDDSHKRELLESIVYPSLFDKQREFVANLEKQNEQIAFCEVPLLYEKQLASLYDCILLVRSDEEVMLQRALERGYDVQKFYNILKAQIPNEGRARIAARFGDYVISGSESEEALQALLGSIITDVTQASK